MARSRRRSRPPSGLSDLLVLDAEGLARAAAGDQRVRAWLERAQELDADLIVSAVTLAEVVRGVARDAGVNRMVKGTEVWSADAALARRAGRLLGSAGSDATVDAIVAATALAAREHHGAARVVVLTSDPDDLGRLVGGQAGVQVVAV